LCRETQASLADAIVSLKLLGKNETYEELAAVYGVPFVNLETYSSDPMVISLIEEKTCRDLEAFPLFAIGQSLAVALVHPGDIMATDRLAAESKLTIEACLAVREDLLDTLNRAYGSGGEIKDFLSQIKEDSVPSTATMEAQERAITNSESPVSRLVDLIVTNAVRDRASDIHISREEHITRVRFRIDGVLYEVPPPPNYLFPFIVSRIKVMSNMDIAENRLPQDGHFRTTIDGQTIETRVSSVPTIHGESIAIRLLDTSQMTLSLEDLGMPPSLLPRVDDMIRRTHGMVVLTGPTGSGKTSTLFASLNRIRTKAINITTI
jgi:type II secretory ATPase GspE/PulE/Tfp pilus assembly ATPase PilB-like protein